MMNDEAGKRIEISEGVFSAVTTVAWSVIGAGYLFYSKYLVQDMSWTPAIICGGLILLLALLVYRMFNGGQRSRLADNCYYMGLIYTLIGMVIVFWRIQEDGGQQGANDTVGEVLGVFSVALTSTIVGIIARLLLQTHSGDIDSESGHEPRQQSDIHMNTMGYSNRRIESEMASLERALRGVRSVMEESERQIKITSDSYSKSMHTASDALVTGIDALNESVASMRDSLQELSVGASKANRDLSVLAKVEPTRAQEIIDKYEDLVEKCQEASDRMERYGLKSIEGFEQLVELTGKLIQQMQDSLLMLSESEQQTRLIHETSDLYNDSMQSASGKIAESFGSLDETIANMRESLQALSIGASKASRDLAVLSRVEPARAQEVIDKYEELVLKNQDASDKMEQYGLSMVERFEKMVETTDRLVKQMEISLSGLRELNKQREQIALRELVSDVTTELRQVRAESKDTSHKKRRRRWWLLWLR